jgi:polysaccharide pyruvyl transferase WcaK-like protein
MKFLISGGYGYGNVGDEAQLAGIINEIHTNFRSTDITVMSPNPEYTYNQHACDKSILASREALFFQSRFPQLYNLRSKREGGPFVKFGNFCLKIIFWSSMVYFLINVIVFRTFGLTFSTKSISKLIKNIHSCDIFFVSGGGFLTESTLSRLLDTSMLLIAAKLLGSRCVLSGQTIGKISSRLNRVWFRWALDGCELISTRDPEDSINSLKSLMQSDEFKKNVLFTSDDALFVKSNEPIIHSYKDYVGLHLHYWGAKDTKFVVEYYKKIVHELHKKNLHKIVLFSMTKSDEEAIEDLMSNCEGLDFFKHEYDYRTVISFMQQLNFIISMKHHPLIFASGGCVPAISVNFSEYYRHKNVGALKNFGTEKLHVNLEVDKFDKISSLIEDVVSNKRTWVDLISSNLKNASNRRNSFWNILNHQCEKKS